MGRPRKARQPTAFEMAVHEINSNPSAFTKEEFESLKSGEAAESLYAMDNDGKRVKSFANAYENPEFVNSVYGRAFESNAYGDGLGANYLKYQDYFVKAFEKLKKDKLATKEKVKLLTEQPGLSAQTRGNSALSLTGGASNNALTPKTGY